MTDEKQEVSKPRGEGALRRMLKRIRLGIVAVAVVLVLIVMFQNIEPVGYQVLFWEVSFSRLLALLIVFLTGAAVGAMAIAGLHARR